MANTAKSTKGTSSRKATKIEVLGRSAATGRVVLAPVITKRSIVTRAEAKNAVALVRSKKSAVKESAKREKV